MPSRKQELESAQKALNHCTKELLEMMATFRTYSGKHLDIDRGDFDVEFFKQLHGKCGKIYASLNMLADCLPAKARQKKGTRVTLITAVASV